MMNKQKAICNACTVGHGCACPDSPYVACKMIAEENIRKSKLKKENDAKVKRNKFEEQVSNTICGTNRPSAVSVKKEDKVDAVKKPEHYRHGVFEVIDEMIIVFGVEATLTFCKLNAWKYRARAPFKGTFEQDMDKANRYLEMAYDISQIRQEYPEAEGYEVVFLLKGRSKQS